jgi:hypothetical protein
MKEFIDEEKNKKKCERNAHEKWALFNVLFSNREIIILTGSSTFTGE